MASKSFVMYDDWKELFMSLPADKAGELIQAVYMYRDDAGVKPQDPVVNAMFQMIRARLDNDAERYEARCAKNKAIAIERERTRTNVNERVPIVTDNDSDNDNDNDKDIKDIKNSAEPKANCEALILNDGSEWTPTASQFAEYVRLYPGIDVYRKFADMRAWLLSNPTKRKTKTGVTRFVNNWLSREQDKGGTQTKAPDKWKAQDERKYDYEALEKRLRGLNGC